MKPSAREKSLKHAPPLLTRFDTIELLLLLFTNLWYLNLRYRISETESSSNTVQSRLYNVYIFVRALGFARRCVVVYTRVYIFHVFALVSVRFPNAVLIFSGAAKWQISLSVNKLPPLFGSAKHKRWVDLIVRLRTISSASIYEMLIDDRIGSIGTHALPSFENGWMCNSFVCADTFKLVWA